MKSNRKKMKFLIILPIIIVLSAIVIGISFSYAEPIEENDVRVKENSDLTYYIDVIYDGKDSKVVTSSDTTTADVHSDYIEVTDKIPDGLIFQGFVNSEDGSIGAVKRSDNSSCSGYVVDGVEGLSYDEDTRTVSFKVKNLQAGCKITIGIITKTPSLGDNKRMDFYNTAYGQENSFSAKSNTVHVFMGKEETPTYTVTYQYTGTVPENVPELPTTSSYPAGTTVGVSQNVSLEGYEFSGWSCSGVTVENSSFEMPANNVECSGSFTEKKVEKYEVSYRVDGEAPEGYKAPKTKEYEVGSNVKLDSLKAGDEVNGYRFLGWETEDITLPSGEEEESIIFEMPNKNIQFTGKFERISYQVSYQFQGSVIPPNAESLLPETKSYYPKEKVTVAEYPQAEGYKFLGWYSADEFTMPEEDVIIYGEWMIEQGTFSPQITKEITNPKTSYQKGDIVQFKITVTNSSDLNLKDIMLEEQTEGSYFIEKENYTVLNDSYVKIPTLLANNSIDVYAEYKVGEDIVKDVTNVVELTGAISENTNYHLDTTKEYKAKIDFNISNITLNINKINEKEEQLKGAEFTLYRDKELTQKVKSGESFQNLSANQTYYLKETKAPTGYQLLGKVLEVTINKSGTISIPGYEVKNSNGIGTVNITNQKINVLPNTGGTGIIPYIIVGLVLIMIGSIFFVKTMNKRGGKK